jgi:DivIVA domain-containing protein
MTRGEVDVFRSAVRDTFLGVSEPPVRSDDVRSKQFSTHWLWEGYDARQVDAFREEIRDTFLGATRSPVKFRRRRRRRSSSPEWQEISHGVGGTQFSSPEDSRGYDMKQVDAFLDAAGIRLAAMESAGRPAGPLVSGAILAGWAEWADSTRFSSRRLREGYDTAEVNDYPAWLRRAAG